MSDLVLGLLWLLVLAVGVAVCVLLKRLGLATTYVRDLLHVGAGCWVIGWPWWSRAWAPVAIVVFAFVAVVMLPRVARARPVVAAISGGDESWSGVVGYTASFAIFTAWGALGAPVPAAVALLSLSLGDGLGGLVGRRFGRCAFRAPFAKKKTLEGSLVVFAGAFAAAHLGAHLLGGSISLAGAAIVALVAAIAEAISPRSTDNLFVPLAAWSAAALVVS